MTDSTHAIDALAVGIHQATLCHHGRDPGSILDAECREQASRLFDCFPGYQDLLDGAALRRLREALPLTMWIEVIDILPETDSEKARIWNVSLWGIDVPEEHEFQALTIAEAADKCREAL